MFPENLKKLREDMGLYQKDMAAKLDQKTTTYQNYEAGRAEPSIAGLCKLADFFCISIDELVGHADLHEADSEEASRIATISSLAKLLSKEEQEKLCKVLKALISSDDTSVPAK